MRAIQFKEQTQEMEKMGSMRMTIYGIMHID